MLCKPVKQEESALTILGCIFCIDFNRCMNRLSARLNQCCDRELEADQELLLFLYGKIIRFSKDISVTSDVLVVGACCRVKTDPRSGFLVDSSKGILKPSVFFEVLDNIRALPDRACSNRLPFFLFLIPLSCIDKRNRLVRLKERFEKPDRHLVWLLVRLVLDGNNFLVSSFESVIPVKLLDVSETCIGLGIVDNGATVYTGTVEGFPFLCAAPRAFRLVTCRITP